MSLFALNAYGQDLIKSAFGKNGGSTYKYDSLNRQIQVVDPFYQTFNFNYYEGLISRRVKNDSIIIKLNNKNLAINYFLPKNSMDLEIREYNDNGYVVYHKMINSWQSHSRITERFFTYKDSNLIERVQVMSDISLGDTTSTRSTIKYEYYQDRLNTLGNDNYGKQFLGKSSKNLVKLMWYDNGTKTSIDYEFDAEGRVIKKLQYVDDGSLEFYLDFKYY